MKRSPSFKQPLTVKEMYYIGGQWNILGQSLTAAQLNRTALSQANVAQRKVPIRI